MKITIDISEASQYSLTPYSVYKALRQEYWKNMQNEHQEYFWGMATACDNATRELYSHITGRPANVKNLILTYTDAEKCYELFKQFANVWITNYLANRKEKNERTTDY